MRESRILRIESVMAAWGPSLVTLAISLLLPGGAQATEVPFGSQSVISTNADQPLSVFAADVDGDGDKDVLSASYLDDTIAWYENNGASPPLWTKRTISTSADGAWAVFAADVDGDGDIDALSASVQNAKIAWYENNGASPPVWTERVISTTAFAADSVFAADVDGDGDMDVLSAGNDDTIAWYENNGASPPLWTQRTISTSADGALAVFAADVDGDGDMDVLSASALDDKIAWYESDGGSPPVWTARTISTAADGAGSVFAADVDGDGDTDVLSTSQNDDKVAWYENNGDSPPTWTARAISTAANGASSVFAADVDGDGDTDVLSTSVLDNKVVWYESDGASPPAWTPRTISTAAQSAQSVFATDVDGDGDTDVLSASQDDDKIAWYENKTIHRSAAFPQARPLPATLHGPWSVRAADLDGDGDVDVVSASGENDVNGDGKLVWYANDGASPPGWTERSISTQPNGVRSVFTADVDGDGDTDILAAPRFVGDPNPLAWYENSGTSPPAWTERIISNARPGWFSVFAADVDDDGDTDVLSASFDDDTIAWYENDGARPPAWTQRVISSSADGARSVFAADVDGDGDVDVISASEATGNNKVAWYENDGASPPSWTERVITTAADVPQSVFAADIDRDGLLDVLVASAQDSTIAWYLNDPTSPLGWNKITISTTASFALSASAADVDGDGDPDVLSASYNDNKIAWYENSGSPLPSWTPHILNTSASGPTSVTAADLDGDGDMDLLYSSGVNDGVAWSENRGGQFALETRNLLPQVWLPGATNALLGIFATHQGRAGDTDLELATLELLFEEAPGNPLTSAEANALVEDLIVYLDNGDSILSPGDVAVATVGTLSLAGGRQTVIFVDGDANARVAPQVTRNYFLALHIAAGAATQAITAFRVIHLTESSSTAEDVSVDLPLSLEFAANAPSTFVTFPPLVLSVVPQDNTLDVPVGTNVTVTFTEPVRPATVTSSTFRLLDPFGVAVPASVGLAPDGRTATLDPTPPGGGLAFSSVYTVDVTSLIVDLSGQAAVPFTSLFATAGAPIGGIPLPSVADQSVLPSPPPGPGPGGASTAIVSAGTLGPNLGYSVSAAGDLNQDQLADFVGGAPGYSPSGLPEAGAVAIYLGSNAAEPSSGNHPREVADVIFTGRAAHDRAGSSVAAGFDFNGDGIGDILIGAEQVNRTVTPPEATGAGRVYLIYFKPQEYDFDADGTPDYLEQPELFVPLSLVGSGISGAVLTGVSGGDQAGYALAAGGHLDTSDTRDDIVIGAPGAGSNNGRVYVLFSISNASATMSLANVGGTVEGVVYMGSAGERLGSSVALPGDVTVPVGPDIAMGAPLADTTQQDAGRVYVAAAGTLVSGTVNASSIPTQVHGDQACEELGFAVAGGGDNRASGSPQLAGGDMDLLIGAPLHDAVASPGSPCLDTTPVPNAGRVIQTTGRLPNAVIGASQVGNTIEGVIWKGVQAGGGLGWSVGRLGDLSGNTLDDIGLGAPFVSPGMNGAGAVYVVEGSANTGLLGSIDSDQVGQIVSGGIFLGTQTGEEAGLALCAAGDLDGDRVSGSTTADDFTVGSPGWDASLGTVHQVLGTLLQQPGECTALGCTVVHLLTGAVLVVPPNAIASGVKYRFAVSGLASLPSACGFHALAGKSLVGWSTNTRTDCGAPPCTSPGFALGPDIEVPTQQSLEYQLTQAEPLALRYCDSTLGWRTLSSGPTTGQVQNNSFLAGRKAVAASGVDTLRPYGVFFDDADHDDVRDICDCSPGTATLWAPPGEAGDIFLSGQGASPTTLSWGPPACLGGSAALLRYDTIRSTNRANFVSGVVCVETNGADTTSTDPQNPPAGQAFYYIVSPENGCASGTACSDAACVQRPARDC